MHSHVGLSYVRAVDKVELSDETVGQSLARVAAQNPNHPALVWLTESGTDSMTWAELYARACGAAARLEELNPERGRVALAAPNSVEWIIAMYACALAGMAVVPISPTVTDDEAAYLLSHARVAVVLAAEPVGRQAFIDIAEVTVAGGSCGPPHHPVTPDDEFLVQYTSGTTGQPKAASLSHRAAVNIARVYGQANAARPGDQWLNPLPLNHVGGTICGVLTTLSFGGTYTVIERFDPNVVMRVIKETSPALVALVPTMLIDVLAMPGVSAADFSCVRTVISGATAVDPGLIEDVERKLDVTILVAYGQSEATAMTSPSPDDTAFVRTQTLGRCLPGRDYMVCDTTGQVVATGTVGELCVRGPLTMSGYLRADGTLDPAVDESGWLHTGDLCAMDDDGVLTFRGRIREVVIRGGLNIYPTEVEQALAEHESLSEVAIFGVSDPRLGERVVAAVLPAAGTQFDLAVLTEFAEQRLSRHKRPSEWIVATTLPRTSTGKVRKHLLREWYEDGTLQASCGAVEAGT
jgi:acyl-CoA synthetase (AMP-forming)/AMP-acid ligase II